MSIFKDLRSALVSLLIFFCLAMLGEFLVGPWMGEDIPLWKIIAVSLITALMTVIPLQKRGLSHGDILKYFRRSYLQPGLSGPQLYTQLLKQFPNRNFRVQLLNNQHIRISRKASWQSFGEVIDLKIKDPEILVQVRPKYYLDLFDQGQALESLNQTEQVLQKEMQTNA